MSVDDNRNVQPESEGQTAYGAIFREGGTMKLVLVAVTLAIAWWTYSYIHTSMMSNVKWPTLTPQTVGLTVLGLCDQPVATRKYIAVEANHAWQIRRPDDAEVGEPVDDPKSAEAQDRGNDPGAVHKVSRGEVVPLEEIMAKCPVVMTTAHFTGASVEERVMPIFDRKYYIVSVGLSDEGRSRYWQFSAKHDKERLVFVLNGEIITCPRMTNMDVSSLEIQPIWVKSDADKLADFINKRQK